MNNEDFAYAAGFVEGEGCIAINKPNLNNFGILTVTVSNTDRQTIDWFQERWPGCVKLKQNKNPKNRLAWEWLVASKKAANFLIQIRTFIVRDIIKQKIAVALDFQKGKRSDSRWMTSEEKDFYKMEQWNAYLWMGELTRRGNVNDSILGVRNEN